jgi:signal peptidase II
VLKQNKQNKHTIYSLLFFIFLFLVDLTTKYVASNNIKYGFNNGIEIFSFFKLTYVHNYGAAFSFLSNQDIGKYLFIFIGIAFSIYALFGILKSENRIEKYTLATILSGALGNLYDRVFYGYVIDFIDFDFGFYNFPVFNFADIFIFLGLFIFVFIKK